jgi:4-hydroxy-3-polyprenylbenzoate decarboxylase
MEDSVLDHPAAVASVESVKPVAWSDLRGWLSLVETAAGQIKHIDAPVDPNEELAAITFMAGRTPAAPALLFNNLVGNHSDARVLANMLGASKERYAIAVGLDPKLSISDMIFASRNLMKRRLQPIHIRKGEAAVNEIVLQGSDIDLTAYPSPKFWPGDGGRYIGTGKHHIHPRPGNRPHQRWCLSTDAAWPDARWAVLFTRQARAS